MERQDIIEAVESATSLVLSTMMELQVEAGTAHIQTSSPSATDGVMAFVGLAGPWVGSGVVCCGAQVACKLSALLLMNEASEVNDDVLDAIGEVANMVFGNFKTTAETKVGSLGLSVPTVIYGQNFVSRSLGKSEWIVVPFDCAVGPFEIRIWFAPVTESHLARLIVNQTHAV
jgi:chemotaxis protein CheX